MSDFPFQGKKILDVTCGSRSIWFDKHHPAAVYCDIREEDDIQIWKSEDGRSEQRLSVKPDIICDFTNLPFPSNTFSLVIFDPPHKTKLSEKSWLAKRYGKLGEDWQTVLHGGFCECIRVLKPDGVLIFKWSEIEIPSEQVWKAIGQKPLFGHHSGKKSNTFWGCFMKLGDALPKER